MNIKNFLVLSASICGLMLSDSVVKAANNSVGFTAGVRLAATLNKRKSEVKVSQSAISDALSKIVKIDDSTAAAITLPSVSYNGALASNATSSYQTRIVASAYNYKPTAWLRSLTNGEWSNDGKMVFGGQGLVFLGIKFGVATFRAGFLMEYPFSNRTNTIGHSISSNGSSSSSSSSLYDITEKQKLTIGVLVGVDVKVNDCFEVGVEGGVKRLRYEYDVSKGNKNLLGFGGCPDNLVSGISTSPLSADALKRPSGLSTIDKLDAQAWVTVIGLTLGFQVNRYFKIMAGGGVQTGKAFTLKDGSSKLSRPDYNIKINTTGYGFLGFQFQY